MVGNSKIDLIPHPDQIRVQFTDYEMRMIDYITNLRHDYHEANRDLSPTRKFNDRKDWQMEYDGVVGEVAFSRFYGGMPDMNTYLYGDSHDFIICGNKIDAKASRWCLILTPYAVEKKPKDIYALVAIHAGLGETHYYATVQSWVTRQHFLQHEFLHTFKNQKTGKVRQRWCLQPEFMQPIHTLGDWCKAHPK